MSAGTTAALAAASAKAKRRIIAYFTDQDATAGTRAVAFTPASPIERGTFGRMQRAGAIREAGADRFYLDPAGLEAFNQGRRKRVGVVAAALGAVIAAAFLFG